MPNRFVRLRHAPNDNGSVVCLIKDGAEVRGAGILEPLPGVVGFCNRVVDGLEYPPNAFFVDGNEEFVLR